MVQNQVQVHILIIKCNLSRIPIMAQTLVQVHTMYIICNLSRIPSYGTEHMQVHINVGCVTGYVSSCCCVT